MPIALDERKKPKNLKIFVTTGEGVEIAWNDGHVSRYTFPYLREHCPCAMCNDERKKKQELGNKAQAFPMYKPRVTAKSASPVGNYAVQIEYSDGHSTGIYSYGHLREICPCEECRKEFAESQK